MVCYCLSVYRGVHLIPKSEINQCGFAGLIYLKRAPALDQITENSLTWSY